jgi:hypothetical protein
MPAWPFSKRAACPALNLPEARRLPILVLLIVDGDGAR